MVSILLNTRSQHPISKKKEEGQQISLRQIYTYKISSSYNFFQLASKYQNFTLILLKHVQKTYKITETHEPNNVLSGQRTTQKNIQAFITPGLFNILLTLLNFL